MLILFKMAFQKCSLLVFEKGLRHSIPVFLSIHASLRESSAAASAWVLCVCPSRRRPLTRNERQEEGKGGRVVHSGGGKGGEER